MEVEEELADNFGCAKICMGHVKSKENENGGGGKEWIRDSGADHHMTRDKTLFEKLREVPPNFYVKQIKGKVPVKYWGEVQLSTDKGNGERGELELREVLYMPGMSVNIFSLQRIRKKGACNFPFKGVPEPGKIIPIYNKVGVQIATMQESFGARPTLICERFKRRVQSGAEVFGGKGV